MSELASVTDTRSDHADESVSELQRTVGEQLLMGGDVAPDRYEVPLEKTFWATRFGMVVDRFGIPWLINCEGSDLPPKE